MTQQAAQQQQQESSAEQEVTALTTRPNAVIGVNMRELRDVADLIFKSKVFGDIQSQEAAAIKVIAGMEMGFSPFQSMSMFDFIQGRPTLNAHGKATLINSSGDFRLKINELTAKNCSISVVRKSDDGQWKVINTETFSWDDAVTAGLTTGNNAHSWKKYPRNMLFARCVSNIWRWDTAELNVRKLNPAQIVEFEAEELNEDGPSANGNGNYVEGEIVEEPAATQEYVESDFPLGADHTDPSVTAPEPPDTDEPDGAPIDIAESRRLDLVTAVNALITEKIGGLPSDQKRFLKGRVIANESTEALEGMLAELNSM